jgi:hypothetical protein
MLKVVAMSAAIAASLSGCTTMNGPDRRAADEARCRDYGFQSRTTAFAECLQRIDLDRSADRRAWLRDDGFHGRFGSYGRF